MPSRREQIKMADDELRAFLAEERVVTCATVGPRGRPHLMPLWYVPDGIELRGWTFAKSQKARNLERDPRATLQVEAGEAYNELRGAMLECDVEVERDTERVVGFGLELVRRYVGAGAGSAGAGSPGAAGAGATAGASDDELAAGVRAQAPKRVGLRFTPTRIVTWDHRKLGGSY